VENQKHNLIASFTQIQDFWDPAILATINGQELRLARVQGEFVWHQHADSDELFLVIEGELHIDFRDRTETLGPGELIVVPRGTEHRPHCTLETKILLLDRAGTRNTGDQEHELSREKLKRL